MGGIIPGDGRGGGDFVGGIIPGDSRDGGDFVGGIIPGDGRGGGDFVGGIIPGDSRDGGDFVGGIIPGDSRDGGDFVGGIIPGDSRDGGDFVGGISPSDPGVVAICRSNRRSRSRLSRPGAPTGKLISHSKAALSYSFSEVHFLQEGLEARVFPDGIEQEGHPHELQAGVADDIATLQPAHGVIGITPLGIDRGDLV